MNIPADHTTCFHCGAECASDGLKRDGHAFCCHGCIGVYELLRSHDACTYYDVQEHPGIRPQRGHTQRYDGFDRAMVGGQEKSPGSRIIVLHLPDMHCASCVWLLERLTRFDSGIVGSRVDVMSRSLTVEYRAEVTSPSRIARLLNSLGYPPVADVKMQPDARRRQDRRGLYTQLGLAGFAAGNVMMIGLARYVAGPSGLSKDVDLTLRIIELGLSLPVLFFCARPWLRSAWGSLRRGVINLDVPVSIGILTIFLRSLVDIVTANGDGFLDSFTGLVFFLLIGRLFQQRAFEALEFERSMMSFFPLSATRVVADRHEDVAIEDLSKGDSIVVHSGEVIPADSILLQSAAVVDYSYLSGESVPVECKPGAMLYAGGRVLGRSLLLSVVKPSTASYMASLWSRHDIHTQRRSLAQSSERFGIVFTGAVLTIATVASLAWLPDVEMAMTVFSSVLIIACPCALTLSMPITYGTAMTMLASRGLFLKNVAAVGELQKVSHVVFDKTGTLTSPEQVDYVGEVLAPSMKMAFAMMARHSTHPVSRAIAQTDISSDIHIEDFQEIPGMGLTCRIGNRQLALGSAGLASTIITDVALDVNRSGAMAIIDGRAVGRFVLRHSLRSGVAEMIGRLRSCGLTLSVVSGDGKKSGETLHGAFESDEMQLSATPDQKVDHIRNAQTRGAHVLMVGDGLNDIAAMSAANVSIAVSNGSSRIVPACDVMIDVERVPDVDRLIGYARAQRLVVGVAFWFTMAYNIFGIILACSGKLSPVITAIMMPMSSLLVIAISVGGAHLTFRRTQWA